ncbi:AAA family ATPase [Pontibacter sp. G13]|uniref:McrB family protein n=1 Tax=Pontibacter sp. G13 TaxID=3074898 RepID=UPI00288C1818|nr:AAA family ATPase [Pontibacter sp. G13]WNJ17281.1 AAA family ATPase [Pontibacter sp. G13]
MNMIKEIQEFVVNQASLFGGEEGREHNSFIFRSNTEIGSGEAGKFFGLISPYEESSGPYHDFGFTIFPGEAGEPWFVTLGVGTLGFKNDIHLAGTPGLVRIFKPLCREQGYCKTNFQNIDQSLPAAFVNKYLPHLKGTLKKYSRHTLAGAVIDAPNSEEGKRLINAFLAGYAKLRDWPSNASHRKAISQALKSYLPGEEGEFETVLSLIENRKFIVLQGPPGTGKTRMANLVAQHLEAKVEFIQFHAETSYSDFVSGIRPKLEGSETGFELTHGALVNVIKSAITEPEVKHLLIIDEINRANLAQVLGPVFYLFEANREITTSKIAISKDLTISALPQNLFVVATMNTADRSLAVVDFALRRRFAWYDMKPKKISDKKFHDTFFSEMDTIFKWYAKSNELNLQPGQAYFLAESKEEMHQRLEFEIMPLIKEYLLEGMLVNATDEFENYFQEHLNKSLFE